jgi:hypothetical protein
VGNSREIHQSLEEVLEVSRIRIHVLERESRLENIGKNVYFPKTYLEFVRIPESVEGLGDLCFSECRSLSSVPFEAGSRLSRIDKRAFCGTSLTEILLPARVEVFGNNELI